MIKGKQLNSDILINVFRLLYYFFFLNSSLISKIYWDSTNLIDHNYDKKLLLEVEQINYLRVGVGVGVGVVMKVEWYDTVRIRGLTDGWMSCDWQSELSFTVKWLVVFSIH